MDTSSTVEARRVQRRFPPRRRLAVVAGLVLLLAFAFAVEEGDLPET
jgi:hypothetical protein